MPSPDASEAISGLRAELRNLASTNPTTSSAAYTSWFSRARSVLTRTLGLSHHITQEFITLKWTPTMFVLDDTQAFAIRFRSAAQEADGYLEAAAAEMESLAASAGLFEATGVDPELWEFVAPDIESGEWGKAATQATLFLEDRIRKWSGERPELVGEKLMSAVFGPSGNYRLGLTEGEKDGWNLLAMGIAKALRNAAAHRIDTRDDHRRYVLGLVGSCSLLLTQMRFEHGNRFQDLSPATPTEPEE